MTALGVVPALALSGALPAVAPAGGLVVLAVLAFAAWDAARSTGRLAALTVHTPPVARLITGRPGTFPVDIAHDGPDPLRVRIGVDLPAGAGGTSATELEATLPPAGRLRHPWPTGAARRGRHRGGRVTVETASPAGLWAVRRRFDIDTEFRVQPDLATGLRSVARFLVRGAVGTTSQRQVGKGREFEKLREYVPGDSYDEIHWKATAKRSHPVTKVFQVERTQEVYVLVDHSRLSGRPSEPDRDGAGDGEPLLERFLRAALLLGAVTGRHGDHFGLVTFAGQVGTFLRAGGGPSHFNACREALLRLQTRPEPPDFGELATHLRLRLRRRALLLFLTCLDDPVAAEGFHRALRLLAPQHLCVAVHPRRPEVRELFTDPDVSTPADLHRALAGHIRWQELRQLQGVLHRGGIQLVTAPSDGLAAALIQRYLDVKQRQVL